MTDRGAPPAREGIQVGVALDVQVLQTAGRPRTEWPGWPGWPPGSTPLRRIQEHVAAYAAALARTGRLVAALLAPEYPAPDPASLPPELAGLPGSGLFRWESRAGVRRLVGSDRRIVHHVPAPFLDTDFGDPAGRVAAGDWGEAGVPRVATVFDLDPLEDPDRWLGSPARRARYQARAEWVGASDLIVAPSERAAEQVARLLGFPPERILAAGADGDLDGLVDSVAAAVEAVTARAAGPAGPLRRPAVLPRKVALVGPMPPHGGGIGVYNHDVLTALASTGGGIQLDAVMTAPEGWTPGGWRSPAGVGRLHPESLGRDVRPAGYDHLIYTLGNSSGHLVTVETALRHPGWLWLHETRLPALATTTLEGLGDEEFRDRMAWLLERAYPGRPPMASAVGAGRSHLALAEAGVGLTGPLVARSAGVLVNSTAARNFLLLDLPPMAWHPPVHVLPPGCPPVRPGRPGRPAGGGPALVVAFGVVSMSKRPDLLVDAAAAAGFDLAFVGPCPPILAELITDRARHLGIEDGVEVAGSVGDGEWRSWMDRAAVAVQLREQSSGEISAAVLDALSAGLPVVTNLPSAADYPEGTVAMLPSGPGAPPDPGGVAETVDRLLGDPARLEALSRAGRDYAAGHQMADLARALLDALSEPGG